MKCAKCGAELKKGCLYCSVCGHEAQIVSDYNVLEDDYLRSLLKDGESAKNPQKTEVEPKKNKKKKNNHLLLILCCCFIVTGAAVGVAVKLYIDNKNANSYDYQIEMAEKELVDHNYENALQYYKTALHCSRMISKYVRQWQKSIPARKNMIQHSFYIWKSFNLTKRIKRLISI